METLTSWLISLVTPIAGRVMAALGLGTVTYTGLNAAVDAALTQAQTAFTGMPADVALIVAKFGFFDYMSITSGGVVSGLVWMWAKRVVVTSGI